MRDVRYRKYNYRTRAFDHNDARLLALMAAITATGLQPITVSEVPVPITPSPRPSFPRPVKFITIRNHVRPYVGKQHRRKV